MSIPGAVAELNKEITRLTQIRDSLLQAPATGIAIAVREKRKYTRSAVTPVKTISPSKKAAAKKALPVAPTSTVPKKRVMSPATKKKISDAAKARAASKSTK